MSNTYDWLEFSFRPKKDGLHDSGYRYIRLVGATYDRSTNPATIVHTPLHQWSDHVVLNGPVNIDVEPDGTIRLMTWGGNKGWVDDHPSYASSAAMFHAADVDAAIRSIEVDRQVREKVERVMKERD